MFEHYKCVIYEIVFLHLWLRVEKTRFGQNDRFLGNGARGTTRVENEMFLEFDLLV